MAKEKETDQVSAMNQAKLKKKAQSQKNTRMEKNSEIAKLQAKIDVLEKQLDEQKDKYLRAEAEIQNMTKHFKKEQSQLLRYDGQDLAKAILPVLDNLKRALAIDVGDENGKRLRKGIQMVHDDLEKVLVDHGVTEVTALNEPFDPTTQQAVQTVAASGDQVPETVVQVLQAGYLFHDRVLRPAMVVVAQ